MDWLARSLVGAISEVLRPILRMLQEQVHSAAEELQQQQAVLCQPSDGRHAGAPSSGMHLLDVAEAPRSSADTDRALAVSGSTAKDLRRGDTQDQSPLPKPPPCARQHLAQGGGTETSSHGGRLCRPPATTPVVVVRLQRQDIEEAAARLAASLVIRGEVFNCCQSALERANHRRDSGDGDGDGGDAEAVVTSEACAATLANALLEFPAHDVGDTLSVSPRSARGHGSSPHLALPKRDPGLPADSVKSQLLRMLTPMLVRVVAMEACGVVSVALGHVGPLELDPSATSRSCAAATDEEDGARAPRTRPSPPPPLLAGLSPVLPNAAAKQNEELMAAMSTMGCSTAVLNLFSEMGARTTLGELERDVRLLRSARLAEAAVAVSPTGRPRGVRQVAEGSDCQVGDEDGGRDRAYEAAASRAALASSSMPGKRSRSRVGGASGMTLSAAAVTALQAVEKDWVVAVSVTQPGSGGPGETEDVNDVPLTQVVLQATDGGTGEDEGAGTGTTAEAAAAYRLFSPGVRDEGRAAACVAWLVRAVNVTCQELCLLAARGPRSSLCTFASDWTTVHERLLAQQIVPQTRLLAQGTESDSRALSLVHRFACADGAASASQEASLAPAHAQPFASKSPSKRANSRTPRKRRRTATPTGTAEEDDSEGQPDALARTTEVTGVAAGALSFPQAVWLPLPNPLAAPGPPVRDFARGVLGLAGKLAHAQDSGAVTAEERRRQPSRSLSHVVVDDPDTLTALEEVGSVLAAVDCVFSARTLVDGLAWKYGRNRISVVSESTVYLSQHLCADGEGPGEDGRQDTGCMDPLVAVTDSREGHEQAPVSHSLTNSEEKLSGGSGGDEDEDGDGEESDVWVACARFMHESGLLYNASGDTFALDVEAEQRW